MGERIMAHGCNVFVNRQLIYNLPEQKLADSGIMSIEHADFDGTERLALVLDGDIVSTFDTPDQVKLGECELIEEVMIGEDKLVRFSGCPNSQASSIVIRGANTHVIDEASKTVSGKQVLAMEAYARALRAMPMHIADNAGYDSAELVSELRAKHFEGEHTWGLQMDNGTIADMQQLGICEAYKVKSQVVLSSSEAAEMILRVDDIVQCAPRQRQ